MERRNIFANNQQKEQELLDLYNSGNYNTEDLCKYFGVARSTIRQNLIRLGIDVTRRNRKKVYILDVNVDRIMEMYNDNITITQIARQMCVDRSVIEKRLLDNGYDIESTRKPKKYVGKDSCYYRLYKKYKTSAEQRNYSFDLSEEKFFELLKGDCYYCGTEPNQIVQNNENTALYNGIDRIDNSKGYTDDNVVTCCWVCNRFKQNMTQEELKEHVNKMHKHLNKGD